VAEPQCALSWVGRGCPSSESTRTCGEFTSTGTTLSRSCSSGLNTTRNLGRGHTGMAMPAPHRARCPAPSPTAAEPQKPLAAAPRPRRPESKAGSAYRGEASSLTTVLSGSESWLGRVSSWGEEQAELGCAHHPRQPGPGTPAQAGTPSPAPARHRAGRQGCVPRGHGAGCPSMAQGRGEPRGRALLTVPRKGAAGSWR